MAIFVEGVRGSGKSKIAVREIRTYLELGLRVATNLDIKPEVLAPNAKSFVTRLPDIPRSVDLELLGKAYPELDPDNPDTYDEKRFGLIVIDELLTSFNSRSWNDKDRLAVVSWFVQSRKLGWRVWLLSQDVDAVDKQLRETLLQEIWHCRSGKNLFSSPILGKILNLFINPVIKMAAPLGFHVLNVYNGKKKDRHHLSKTEFFKCYELHSAYKTSQQFTQDIMLSRSGQMVDMRATYTILPSNYFEKKLTTLPGEIISPGQTPPKKNVRSFGWQLPAFILCLGVLWFISSSADPEKITDTASALTEVVTAPVIQPEQPSEKPPLTDFESMLESVVITCAVVTGQAHADFCFESDKGAFYPTDLGYKVTYLAPCVANVAFMGESKLIRCRPHYVHSEGVELASNNTDT
jgi:hypothetical protein